MMDIALAVMAVLLAVLTIWSILVVAKAHRLINEIETQMQEDKSSRTSATVVDTTNPINDIDL